MKRRIVAALCAVCLGMSGCGAGAKTVEPTPFEAMPARTLLVVPCDRGGGQAFLLMRWQAGGDVCITAVPRECVFSRENEEQQPLRTIFAGGGAVGLSDTLAAFRQNGFPVDCILSVDVSDAGSGLYQWASSLCNNLLFTNPPAVVYTVGNSENSAAAVALSFAQLRRMLSLSVEETGGAEAYARARAAVAAAFCAAAFEAYGGRERALFSDVFSAGNSTASPADAEAFRPFASTRPQVRIRLLSGVFVGEGNRTRFYPRVP